MDLERSYLEMIINLLGTHKGKDSLHILAASYSNLGDAYVREGKQESALMYYELAIETLDCIPDREKCCPVFELVYTWDIFYQLDRENLH